uniref:Uncharacterized protein n=2 Tax=Aegilops tauschii subsp. strangulata TaxID=200361 RepID=A0A452XIU4_AEGTS
HARGLFLEMFASNLVSTHNRFLSSCVSGRSERWRSDPPPRCRGRVVRGGAQEGEVVPPRPRRRAPCGHP